MSRSKKQLDAIAELKREIKDRDDTIKSLRRQLRKLNDELSPKKEKKKVEAEKPIAVNDCPSCKKGKLKTVDLGPRQFMSCSQCSHRIVVKRG